MDTSSEKYTSEEMSASKQEQEAERLTLEIMDSLIKRKIQKAIDMIKDIF